MPQQFKAAEGSRIPFAVILGDEEIQKGVVRIKELGLPEGHPLKDGELVEMVSLTSEVRKRLDRKHELDDISRGAEGLRVVGGTRGEDVKPDQAAETASGDAPPAPAEEPKPSPGA